MILSDETKKINHVKKINKITTAIHSKWEGVCKIYGFLPRFYLHYSQNLWEKKQTLNIKVWHVRTETCSTKTRKWQCTTSGFTNKCLCTFQRTPCWIYNRHPGHPRSDVIPQEIHWKTVLSKVCEIKCEGKSSVQNSSNRHFFFSFFLLYCLNIHINKLFPG